MMNEVVLVSMALAGVLAVMGAKTRCTPILVVSSLGWVILSFELYEMYGSLLHAALLWVLAFSQVLLFGGKQ